MASVDQHERHRGMVCVVCYKKCFQKVKGKVLRELTKAQIKYISDNVINGYAIDNPYFPSGICITCNIRLNGWISGKPVSLPNVDYDPGEVGPLLRGKNCECKICKTALSTIHVKRFGRKGGRPKTSSTTTPERERPMHIMICSKCFAKIGKGLEHDCSARGKVNNIQNILTPKSSQRFASRIISEQISANNSANNTTPALSTFGKKKPLAKDNCKKQITFSVEDISNMQVDVGLSTKQTLKIAEHLRSKPIEDKGGNAQTNRKILESNLRSKLREKNCQLDSLFEVRKANFVKIDEKKKLRENFDRELVVCNDLDELSRRIIKERDMEEGDLLFRVGMDGGGGFLKVCLNVFDLKKDHSSEDERQPPKKKKRLDEIFKDSGVKKTMIIALVPEVQENYCNIKRLWLEAGLEKFSRRFVIATDMKLINILLGLMSHSSTHPCSWCNVTKDNLHNRGESRTVGNMMDLFWSYFEARAEKKDASTYGNVIHPNMFSGNQNDSTPLIVLIPPPELHLLLGPVNKMYDEMLEIWPQGEEWSNRLYIKREEYHGGHFNGNDSRKLLKNISVLKEIAPPTNKKVLDYIAAFEAFNDVVASCYTKKLLPNYTVKIEAFRIAYKKLKISITPKVHAVFHHIREFCELVKMGLGPFSEQAAESLHHDFDTMWTRFKVKKQEHSEYGNRLLNSVVMYNSQHM